MVRIITICYLLNELIYTGRSQIAVNVDWFSSL